MARPRRSSPYRLRSTSVTNRPIESIGAPAPARPPLAPAELTRLRREVKSQAEDLAILKKAARYFARESK
jgi:hypothetical protein